MRKGRKPEKNCLRYGETNTVALECTAQSCKRDLGRGGKKRVGDVPAGAFNTGQQSVAWVQGGERVGKTRG